jgi:hypothetical protein
VYLAENSTVEAALDTELDSVDILPIAFAVAIVLLAFAMLTILTVLLDLQLQLYSSEEYMPRTIFDQFRKVINIPYEMIIVNL